MTMAKLSWIALATALAFGCSSGGGGGTGKGGAGGNKDGGSGGGGGAGGNKDAAAGGSGGATDAHLDSADSGDAANPALKFTWDTANSGGELFEIDTFPTVSPVNLGATPDGGSGPVLTFDSQVGMPVPGSLKLTVTFTDYNQTVTIRHVFMNNATAKLGGKTVTGQIRLDAGSAAFKGVAHLIALSTPTPNDAGASYIYAQGNSVGLLDNNFHVLTFNLTTPEFASAGFDANDIVQFGLQLASPAAPAADAAQVPFGAAEAITIHLDSVVSN
jgi:hypothetical protein